MQGTDGQASIPIRNMHNMCLLSPLSDETISSEWLITHPSSSWISFWSGVAAQGLRFKPSQNWDFQVRQQTWNVRRRVNPGQGVHCQQLIGQMGQRWGCRCSLGDFLWFFAVFFFFQLFVFFSFFCGCFLAVSAVWCVSGWGCVGWGLGGGGMGWEWGLLYWAF